MESSKITQQEKQFEIKPYSAIQLSELYGVSEYIMRKWLRAISKKLGRKQGWYFSLQQVKIILKEYGVPGKTVNEEE